MSVDIDMWFSELNASLPSARSLPVQTPVPYARRNPVKGSSPIVLENMTVPAALDPEVITLDKWIPLLMTTHH